MKRRLAGIAVVNAVVLLAALLTLGVRFDEWNPFGSAPAVTEPAASDEITVVDGAYADARFRVRAGSVVSFGNRDGEVHTFTAEGGLFDSGLLEPGGSYRWSSGNAREVRFHCEIHPGMQAVLVVEEA